MEEEIKTGTLWKSKDGPGGIAAVRKVLLDEQKVIISLGQGYSTRLIEEFKKEFEPVPADDE